LQVIVLYPGRTVAGPVGRLDAARTVMLQKIDCATLDVKHHGDTLLPLADVLIASESPVILLSGYDSNRLPTHCKAGFRR
jgi:hypothetical protein